jgi:hypothetical protein
VAVLTTVAAALRSSVEAQKGVRAIRVVTYYLTFFAVTNLVREERQLLLLLRGFSLLATAVAAAVIAQFLLGESVSLLPGRVEALRTQAVTYQAIARILPPGQSLILVTFITTTVLIVLDRSRSVSALRFLQWGLLGLALVLTFSRSFWVAAIVATSVLACLVRGRDRQRFIQLFLVVGSLAAVTLVSVLAKPESRVARLMMASMDRLGTVAGLDKVSQDSSFQWRYPEYEHAFSQIASHPLVGLGLGAEYRPWDPRLDSEGPEGFDGRGYIHNGHLWILVKTGLVAYLCLVWLSLLFLIRGFTRWRSISHSQIRGMVLGFTLTYVGVLLAAVANPIFMQWFWTPVIGMIMGANEVATSGTAGAEVA